MLQSDRFLSEFDAAVPRNVFFGDVVYSPGGTYGPREQPNYQLVLIHYGHVAITLGHQAHGLDRGEVALLKPGHREYFRFSETTRTRHSWCHFTWELSREAQEAVEGLAFKVPISQRMEHLVTLGLSLQHDPQVLAPSLSHLAAAVFWEFVAAQVSGQAQAPHATLPTALSRVQTYIVQHYAENLTLAKLGEIACLTPEHLSRLFRRHLDTTPMNYLWRVRVEQSVSRLCHTGLAVEEIAYQCGFKSAAHFSKKVKALRGQTPSEIRSRYLHHPRERVAPRG